MWARAVRLAAASALPSGQASVICVLLAWAAVQAVPARLRRARGPNHSHPLPAQWGTAAAASLAHTRTHCRTRSVTRMRMRMRIHTASRCLRLAHRRKCRLRHPQWARLAAAPLLCPAVADAVVATASA